MKNQGWLGIILVVIVILCYGIAWNIAHDHQSLQSKSNKSKDSFPLIEPNIFRIAIPEKFEYTPKVNKQNIQSLNSTESAQLTGYTYSTDERVYSINFVRYPSEVFERKLNVSLLDDLRDGLLQDYNASMLQETTNYQLLGQNAREIDLQVLNDSNNFKYIHCIMIIKQPFVFILSIQAPDRAMLKDVKSMQFFQSFQPFQNDLTETVIVGNN